jgi:hypothetical protein
MNLGTAIETMELASTLDAKLKISALLERTIVSLSNLTSRPEDPSFQANTRSVLHDLAVNLSKIDLWLSDADAARLEELGASELFPSDLYDKIMDQFNAHVATPSVSKSYVQEILNTRTTILAAFSTVVGVAKTQKCDLGGQINLDVEIGFPVHPAIIHDNMTGLPKQLDWINRFMLDWKTPTEIRQRRNQTSNKGN